MSRPATPAEVVAAVRSLGAARGGAGIWVGIDGRGASGKSTLAAMIAAAVADVDVVRIDDFWGPSIATFDASRMVDQVIEPLLAGRPTRYQVWDWDRDLGGPWVPLVPGRVVVVEGVSATSAALGVPWSLRVWVDAPRQVRLDRALARDGAAMMPRWHEDWMPSEEAYLAAERPDLAADLVVDGTYCG